jgi:hypothetical protein
MQQHRGQRVANVMGHPGGQTAEQGKMLRALGFAFQSLALRRLPLQRGHAVLQLGIQPGQLLGLAVEIGEHPHFGPQQLRHDGRRQVVHPAAGISLELIERGEVFRRDEENGGVLVAGVLADEIGQGKPIEFGHLHIEEDDGDRVDVQQVC